MSFLDSKEPAGDGKAALRPTRLSGANARPAHALRAACLSLRGVADVGTVTVGCGTARAEARGSAQEHGKEWEFCVLAVNEAGEGTPSDTVMGVW